MRKVLVFLICEIRLFLENYSVWVIGILSLLYMFFEERILVVCLFWEDKVFCGELIVGFFISVYFVG